MDLQQNQQSPEDNIDEPLLERFQQHGFRDAFGVLWLHHQLRMGRFVQGRGLNADRAEDLLQEIGIKLFRYLSRHVVELFPGAAYKITKDEIADYYRSLSRIPKLETLDDLIAINLEPAASPPNKKMEHWTALQQHMDECGVSREQQTAVILKHLIGYSVKEVAEITGCNREAVKSRLRYASLRMGRARKLQGVP